MNRPSRREKSIEDAEAKAAEASRETDEAAEDANKLVEDLKAVTADLKGALKGGISEADNSKLERILQDAADIAGEEFEDANERRSKLVFIEGEWAAAFRDAAESKQIDHNRLEQALGRLTSDRVRRLVQGAVDDAEREADTYQGLRESTEDAITDDEHEKQRQERAKQISSSIRVQVG